MRFHEIIVAEIQRDRSLKIFKLFTESIAEAQLGGWGAQNGTQNSQWGGALIFDLGRFTLRVKAHETDCCLLAGWGSFDIIMKISFIALLLAATMLSGCVSTGPAISKDTMGNLEVYVTAPQGVDVHPAQIYVDGIFVGNVSETLPVLYLKRGKHVVRVELAGMKTYEQGIDVLGEPNHQFLYVPLEKK